MFAAVVSNQASHQPRSIKEMLAGDKLVSATHFHKDALWYVTPCGFAFPVPLSDVGDATLPCSDRAMLYMRYVRKHLEALQSGQGASPDAIDIPIAQTGVPAVRFTHYVKGDLWYATDSGFAFPVPTSAAGDTVMHANDRADLYTSFVDGHVERLKAEQALIDQARQKHEAAQAHGVRS